MPEIKGVVNRHSTLDRIAKFISGIGWLVVIVSGFAVLFSLGQGEEYMFAGVLSGLGGALLGLIVVAQGQLISVVGSIELNTQRTYRILAHQVGEDVHGEPDVKFDASYNKAILRARRRGKV